MNNIPKEVEQAAADCNGTLSGVIASTKWMPWNLQGGVKRALKEVGSELGPPVLSEPVGQRAIWSSLDAILAWG